MTSKKYLPTLLLALTSLTDIWGQAAQAEPPAKAGEFADIMTSAFLVMFSLLFLVVIATVVRTNAFLTKRVMRLEAEKNGVTLPSDAEAAPQMGDDFFIRLRKKYWEDPVPREREGEITLNHNYDGIRELDNHLPPWWVNLFLITIVWAVGYMWFYHWGGSGLSQEQRYEKEVADAKKEIAVALAGKANAVDESNVVALTDAAALGEGELIYKNVCAACHGQKGEGAVGPNLTDEYWLHGGGIKNIFKTVKYGVPEKGMIAWSSQLKPADIQKVSSYILTMQGTNPPNPKGPQGEIWKETEGESTNN